MGSRAHRPVGHSRGVNRMVVVTTVSPPPAVSTGIDTDAAGNACRRSPYRGLRAERRYQRAADGAESPTARSVMYYYRCPACPGVAAGVDLAPGGWKEERMARPTSVPIPPTVRRGNEGPCVSNAQGLLTAHGVSPGPIDGIFGPRTDEATRTFQRGRGLDVDGIIGPHTWTHLMNC